MILDYVTGNLLMLSLKLIITSFLWFVVLVAIGVDLYFGITKAKKYGELTHSHGLQRTVQKVVNYLAMMLFMLIFDAISPFGLVHDKFNTLPLASIVGCAVLVWTEFISVREKSEQKFRRRTDKVAKDLLDLAMQDENLIKKLKDSFREE